MGEKDSNGWTPLHHALRNGQLEVVKWLKEQGADICEKARYGSSAMDLASQNGHSDLVRWLQEQGATTGASSWWKIMVDSLVYNRPTGGPSTRMRQTPISELALSPRSWLRPHPAAMSSPLTQIASPARLHPSRDNLALTPRLHDI